MHARVVFGVGKGVLFTEVSSVQVCLCICAGGAKEFLEYWSTEDIQEGLKMVRVNDTILYMWLHMCCKCVCMCVCIYTVCRVTYCKV